MSECISGAVCVDRQTRTVWLSFLSLYKLEKGKWFGCAVLVSVVQKLGYSNIKLSHDSPGQARSFPGV
jgi:hypothetical protein